MSRRLRTLATWLACASVFTTGCHPSQPFYFFEDGDMSHYRGVAKNVEYPDVEAATLAEVQGALPPLTVRNTETKEIWDLTLEEAVHNSLSNSKVMRSLGGQVQVPPSRVLTAPDGTPTVYDPAIAESNPRTGVEGALSAFDAQWQTSMLWARNERPVNITGLFGTFLAPNLQQDQGQFQTQLSKLTATGGQVFLRNNTTYDWNNNPSNLFPSVYNTNIEAEFRHPLLQGAGVQFNRIAGPNATPGSFTFGFGNGVILARINSDIALANFEAGVRNLVNDVEVAYWELYYAYRQLDSLIAGRDSALQTWRKVYALYQAGGEGGRAEEEAQAREQYYLFVNQVHQALSRLYETESRLRYIMGLAATDGRLIRPAEEPSTAKLNFDWFEIHNESLARSVELRQQKWRVKRREMELTAARNFLLPRLDATGRYRWLGFGDDLIRSDREGVPEFDNAFNVLTGGEYQEWQVGFQATVPIGFRQALAGVRNSQLSLARERAVLQDQELELSHQLSDAVRDLEAAYLAAQDNFNRRIAAQRQVDAVKAAYDVGQVTLDLLLDAQRRLADAESQYFRAVVDYNLSIATVHLRKGSLLEYNGVYLAEGPWPGKAYFDANKRGRERDAAYFLNYGFTRPTVFSRGVVNQRQERANGYPGDPMYSAPVTTPAETVPAPKPQPEDQPLLKPETKPAPSVLQPAPSNINGPRLSQNQTQNQNASPFAWGSLGLGEAQQPARQIGATHRDPQLTPTAHYESRPNQPVGANHQPAAEWKGVQYGPTGTGVPGR